MNKFHLGWFLARAFSIQGWNEPGFPQSYDWTKPDLFQDAARALERANFDLFIIEDSSCVPDNFGGSMEVYLKHAAMTPKLDPVVLVPYLTMATRHIGIAPTLTSTFYPPFLLARLMATLDHVTGGRVGWNIVTATNDRAAQNYGLEKQYEHDLRYDMADEYIDLVRALWDSWEEGAVVMDLRTGIFADPTKVHRVDFEGKFYRSRGPLNVPRSPQGRPVFVTPGGSPRGRQFSGRNADVVLAGGPTVEHMKDYRDEVLKHAVDFGRDPSTCKVMFTVSPTIVGRGEDAEAIRRQAGQLTDHRLETALASMSYLTGIDFSQFDLDTPLPEIKTNGMQTILSRFAAAGPEATLREIVAKPQSLPLVGTAEEVADRMGEVMEEVGGDGFLITGMLKPSYLAQITDQLVPALQRRDIVRDGYGHDLLRDNILDF